MINPHEWLRTRRNLLDQVKNQVQVRLGPAPPQLRRYAKSLATDFRGNWQSCLAGDLENALNAAKVVLGSDFHAYAQSQRAHVRILRDLVHRSPVVLALECLSVRDEAAANDFLNDRISENEFLEAVHWRRNWGFPWEHYRPLFELARERGFEIRGLNRKGLSDLKRRDRWTAERIERLHRRSPDALVYVIMGELHLASPHLPSQLRAAFPAARDIAIVHQDGEQLYFKLAQRNQETTVEFLKSSGNRFCVMVSPPWMKWQSYLMYLEHAYDQDLQEDLAIDYSDHLVSLVELLERDLKFAVKKNHVQVYSPSSKTSMARLKAGLPKRQQKALVYYLEHDLSFYIPNRGWLYLSRPTINHASALAGQFLHGQLSHRRRPLWNLPTDFLPLIWVEAVGFFFSKWINPKRKAETLDSIRLQLEAGNPRDKGRSALLLSLDHRLSEVVWVKTGRLRKSRFKPGTPVPYLEASRILGSMLGERLFQKVRSRTISLAKLMSYLKMDVETDKTFHKFYWQLIQDVEPRSSR